MENEIVRKFLEWSFNYGSAEELTDCNLRERAEALGMGIPTGESQEDATLIQDFLERRIIDFDTNPMTILPDWPLHQFDESLTPALFWDTMTSFPGYAGILEDVRKQEDE